MQPVASTLNPEEYVIIPHVCVLDEFRMTDESGTLIANITPGFMAKLIKRMNEREATTGDLCPIAIGHTDDERHEVDQGTIGWIRNWHLDDFFDTGRKGAFVDWWLRKHSRIVINGTPVVMTAKEINDKWPRRSCEVWADRYEVDPVSILGATTPARDLGLIKLNRGGSFTYYAPGDINVPDEKKSAEDVAKVGELPVLQELKGMMQEVLAALKSLAPSGAAGAMPEKGGEGGAGGEGEMSDAELEQLLQSMSAEGGEGGGAVPGLEDEESRKGKEPVKNDGYGYPGGMNTKTMQLSREEFDSYVETARKEKAELVTQLARFEIKAALQKLKDENPRANPEDINPEDEALITDLAAMPADLRARQLERIGKMAKKTQAPVGQSFGIDHAIANASDGSKPRKGVTSQEDRERVVKLALQKGILYEQAATELGFSPR